jgi:tetraacyldisaccharide 4'-kinase
MGGTLAARGGHNILEPSFFGKPVIAGPHMENFAEIAREFSAAGALVRIGGPTELAEAVEALLADDGRAREIGTRARELAMAKRGVVDRVAAVVLEAAGRGVCSPPRTLAARVALRPLACLWAAGHRVNRRRGQAAARYLKTRVVSVGGLTMGGAGKSPLVAHLAARLADEGRNPAILTRGYERGSSHEIVIVPRGSTEPIQRTGDEAQMFVRRAKAHVGIGGERYDVGCRLEADLRPDVFLLDDGFQHVRLKRDEDIVLVDALDPLGGGLFPLGRRREPMHALARATAVVITRVQPGISTSGIEALIRRYNSSAPIFRSRVAPAPWEGPARRVGAFCGIGSPRSFWRTLTELNLKVVYRREFRDHYVYHSEDVRNLGAAARAAGAEILVATEKDMMNLPPDAAALAAPLEIRCVRIAVEIENEVELLRRVL